MCWIRHQVYWIWAAQVPKKVCDVRLDIISIFPEYLAPLQLSLLGKAQRDGLLSLKVFDLRSFTSDRHHSVDDTPYGGGAGMVMLAEPWALALEQVLAEAAKDSKLDQAQQAAQRPLLLVPSPAGQVFSQELAYELSRQDHLIFAPARYEGIDERVFDWAQNSFRVLPLSLGDYVLYGGEAAVLVMVEAICRLIPGAVGNPQSLAEESHTGGLLEYPVYTKPPIWRGFSVPEVLRSGDHGAIARWRREQQLKRTFERRPDMIAALSDSAWDADDQKILKEIRDSGEHL